MVHVRTDLIDPHIYLDCEMTYRREIAVLHRIARNACYLNDWIWYFRTHFDQSESTIRRRIKEMEERQILKVDTLGKTYIQLQRNGISYSLGRLVSSPRPLQSNLQLEKSYVILRNCGPKLALIRKGARRNEILAQHLPCTKEDASHLFQQIERIHIYLLGVKLNKHSLIVNLLHYDPYTGVLNPFYKVNQALELILQICDLASDTPINLDLTIAAANRIVEKRFFAQNIEDRFSKENRMLRKYCLKDNSFTYYTWENVVKRNITIESFERSTND